MCPANSVILDQILTRYVILLIEVKRSALSNRQCRRRVRRAVKNIDLCERIGVAFRCFTSILTHPIMMIVSTVKFCFAGKTEACERGTRHLFRPSPQRVLRTASASHHLKRPCWSRCVTQSSRVALKVNKHPANFTFTNSQKRNRRQIP